MYVQIIANVVVDESQLSESVHEETDPRASGPDHLCQGLLAESRDRHLRHPFLAELRHQQENSRQPLFAGIKQLIDQIILIPHVSLQ